MLTTAEPNPEYALNAARSSAALDAEITRARERAREAKEAAKMAKKELESFAKKRRDQARENTRRAQIVGEVVLALSVADPVVWNDISPHVQAALSDAKDEDRVLFGLPTRTLAPDGGSHLPDEADAMTPV